MMTAIGTFNSDVVNYVLSSFDEVKFVPHSYDGAYNNLDECIAYISNTVVTMIDGVYYYIVIRFYNTMISIELAGIMNNIGVYNKTEINEYYDIDREINTFKMKISKRIFSLDEFSNITKPSLLQASVITYKILGEGAVVTGRDRESTVYNYNNHVFEIVYTRKTQKLNIYFRNKKIKSIRINKEFAFNLKSNLELLGIQQ